MAGHRKLRSSAGNALCSRDALASTGLYDVLGTGEAAKGRARERPQRAVERIGGRRQLVVQREEDEVAASPLERSEAMPLEQAVELPWDARVHGECIVAPPAEQAAGAMVGTARSMVRRQAVRHGQHEDAARAKDAMDLVQRGPIVRQV